MLMEEYGVSTNDKNPLHAGIMTFFAFLACGLVPLFPFMVGMADPFFYASISTGFVFFLIGAMKSYWSVHPWWRSGFETLFIGVLAAAIAYAVGYMIGHSV